MRIQKSLNCKWVLIPHDKDDLEFIAEYFPRAKKMEVQDLTYYRVEED